MTSIRKIRLSSWLRPFGKKQSKPQRKQKQDNAAAAAAAALVIAIPAQVNKDEESVASTSSVYSHSSHKVLQQERSEESSSVLYEEATPDSNKQYDYEDAAPANYGYEEAAPDHDNDDDRTKYEYGDLCTAPDTDTEALDNDDYHSTKYYGYGDPGEMSPRSLTRNVAKTPRRSSMKQSGAPRRSSIGISGEVEVELPVGRGRVKRRTSISFDERVERKVVETASSLTENPQDLWFQNDEYQRIGNRAHALVQKVADQTSTGGECKKYCMRGLEGMLTPEETTVKKHQAWDVVLSEQYLQKRGNEHDEEHIANLYKFSTMRSQDEAAKRANHDAQEAESYLRKTRFRHRRGSM
jgi:hypothetical protein